MLEQLMDRYRGRPGFFGWLVLRADIRWLKRHKRAVLDVDTVARLFQVPIRLLTDKGR